MRIFECFNKATGLVAALSAGFVLLAATEGTSARDRGHQSTATVSSHVANNVANSLPIIAKSGHDHHRGHHHGLGFSFAQTYWLVDSPCTLRRVHLDRYTDAVIIRRGKPCAATSAQVVTVPSY